MVAAHGAVAQKKEELHAYDACVQGRVIGAAGPRVHLQATETVVCVFRYSVAACACACVFVAWFVGGAVGVGDGGRSAYSKLTLLVAKRQARRSYLGDLRRECRCRQACYIRKVASQPGQVSSQSECS